MGLFDKKPRVEMESFCKYYYDTQLFHSLIDGKDISQEAFSVAFQTLKGQEPSFSKVNFTLFECEMTAMHLEHFSLAFLKRFPDIGKAYRQIAFTQHYLQERNRNDIWEAMGDYSQAVAKSATTNSDGQPMTGDTAIGRMTITRVNEFRFGIFKKMLKQHSIDRENLNEQEAIVSKCIARVCNHIEADINKKNEVGNRLISALFLSRLGAETIWGENCEPSKDFLFSIATLSLSMNELASNTLKLFDIQF